MQKDRPDETVVGSPAARQDRHARAMEVIRDPRDYRELLTDVLGITTDASTLDVVDDAETAGQANLLGRRKRDKAWREIQDPSSRLVEEALLYPMEPVPTPTDDEFPYYDAELPGAPTLYRTEDELQRLIETVAAAIPTDVANAEATLRITDEPPLPDLPEPDFAATPIPPVTAAPQPTEAEDAVDGAHVASVTAESAEESDGADGQRDQLDVDDLLPEDADTA
jgi:hypothetical protein